MSTNIGRVCFARRAHLARGVGARPSAGTRERRPSVQLLAPDPVGAARLDRHERPGQRAPTPRLFLIRRSHRESAKRLERVRRRHPLVSATPAAPPTPRRAGTATLHPDTAPLLPQPNKDTEHPMRRDRIQRSEAPCQAVRVFRLPPGMVLVSRRERERGRGEWTDSEPHREHCCVAAHAIVPRSLIKQKKSFHRQNRHRACLFVWCF